jgi:hypothetical protein
MDLTMGHVVPQFFPPISIMPGISYYRVNVTVTAANGSFPNAPAITQPITTINVKRSDNNSVIGSMWVGDNGTWMMFVYKVGAAEPGVSVYADSSGGNGVAVSQPITIDFV